MNSNSWGHCISHGPTGLQACGLRKNVYLSKYKHGINTPFSVHKGLTQVLGVLKGWVRDQLVPLEPNPLGCRPVSADLCPCCALEFAPTSIASCTPSVGTIAEGSMRSWANLCNMFAKGAGFLRAITGSFRRSWISPPNRSAQAEAAIRRRADWAVSTVSGTSCSSEGSLSAAETLVGCIAS
jgi:hypothetical protein